MKHFVVITWDCTITFSLLGTLHSVNFTLLLKGCLMFPSNVLPNNKKFLKLQYKFWPLNSSHRGLHGSKISRVSHVRFFKLISHTSTLLRVIVKEIYINVSSRILTRKPDSVRHCKRGFTSNCAELIRSDRSHVHSQFPVLPC